MSFILTAGGVALATFLFALVRSGRFGATVLSLAAGYVLALFWADTLASYSVGQFVFLTSSDVAYAVTLLVPGVLALLFGRKQKGLLPGVVGAAVLALFVVALLLDIFPVDAAGHQAHALLERYREVTISVVLVLGLFDVLLARLPKSPKRTKD